MSSPSGRLYLRSPQQICPLKKLPRGHVNKVQTVPDTNAAKMTVMLVVLGGCGPLTFPASEIMPCLQPHGQGAQRGPDPSRDTEVKVEMQLHQAAPASSPGGHQEARGGPSLSSPPGLVEPGVAVKPFLGQPE